MGYWLFCASFGLLSLSIESRLWKLAAFVGMVAVVGGMLALLARRRPADEGEGR